MGCFWVDLELLPRAVDTCAPKFVVVGGANRVSAGGWGPGGGATYAGRRWCKVVCWCTLVRGEVGCWSPWAPFSLRTSWFPPPVECFKAPHEVLGAQAACLAPRAGEGGADLHAPFHREGGGQSQHVGSPNWLQPALHVPLWCMQACLDCLWQHSPVCSMHVSAWHLEHRMHGFHMN